MEEKIITTTVEEVLKMLQVDGSVTVALSEESIDVSLETNDTGVVIGYHGEVLESLQLVLALCVSKKIGRFVRVSLEVGDYKKNRTEWLEHIAAQAKEQALQEGKAISLPSLKSWERRIVHMHLQNDAAVISESVGEGRERTLVVKPKE
jgi:spoIIIJ-associated protein